MTLDALISAAVTLFVIIDPVGTLPIFATVTSGMTARRRMVVAAQACLVSFLILCLFGGFGAPLFAALGIGTAAFLIAGGVLLLLNALQMVFEQKAEKREKRASTVTPEHSPAIYPLSIPIMAGPGSITATMMLVAGTGSTAELGMLAVVLAGVFVLAFCGFLLAGFVSGFLGPQILQAFSRVLGLVLAALACQFVLNGISIYLEGLPGS